MGMMKRDMISSIETMIDWRNGDNPRVSSSCCGGDGGGDCVG